MFVCFLCVLIEHFSPESSHNAETEHWRKQYEELFSKVKPFQVSYYHPVLFGFIIFARLCSNMLWDKKQH